MFMYRSILRVGFHPGEQLMTKGEKKQVEHIWAELENIISVIDPSFNIQEYIKLKNFDRRSLNEILNLITFLRIEVRYLLFDNEALQRENSYLYKLAKDSGESSSGLS